MKAYLCDCTGIKKVALHFSRFVGHIMTSELAYAVRGYGVNLTETSLKNAIEKVSATFSAGLHSSLQRDRFEV